MDVAAHYDLLIEENNDPFRDPPVLQQYMDRWDGETFLEAMYLSPDKRVLEIGVGTGRIAARVAPRCRHLTGVDISPKTIARAEENLKEHPNVSLVCGDFLTLPFAGTYDVICSSLTMMHFKEKGQVVAKVKELLEPGGVFCLSIDKSQETHIDMGTRRIRIFPDTPEEIGALITAEGMRLESVLETEHAYIMVSRK